MKNFRIVSLCPSTTLTLFDLGLGTSLVGRTKYCIKPENEVGNVESVGGTKNPNWQRIAALNPSHILFNMEENEADDLAKAQAICKTLVDTPVDIDTTLQQLKNFAEIFGVYDQAIEWQNKILDKLNELQSIAKTDFSFLYFIWDKPKMLAGRGTYIDALLSAVGGRNLALIFSEERYPKMSEGFSSKADVVFLSSEPFHYQEKHIP
ncbi:MAG: helical backbone metal receptor, partial [Spirochaetota bacterium]